MTTTPQFYPPAADLPTAGGSTYKLESHPKQSNNPLDFGVSNLVKWLTILNTIIVYGGLVRKNWYYSQGFEPHSGILSISQDLADVRSLPFNLILSQTKLFS
ncbi:MAG: hypothetical protein MUO27_05885, partial [Sedimentisphaerales bacterium]|nr:hypothetical protein [Sedimentisphaerales bacterium]